jgi:thioredoxin reductase (NADPH)
VTGLSTNIPASSLFVMIGADPSTGWLKGSILLDSKGFVRTGESAAASLFQSNWAGVFAIGDVRSGSVKRVASAVGEGSVVIQAVHRYLASLRELPPTTEMNQP